VANNTLKSLLWQFTDDFASFRVLSPETVSRLYFPLANEGGILSSITPNLHGDIKTSQNSFLTLPLSAEDLPNIKSNRNFWLFIEGRGAWSATGVSATQNAAKFIHKNKEKTTLDAGMLWHKVTRDSQEMGVRSEITNFVPIGNQTVELMMVTVKNIGTSKLTITPTSAIPIYARSADNLRDHRHVTSLLHRIISHPAGVVVKPTMSFDERGHKLNEISYAVLGIDSDGDLPKGSFYTVPDFLGEGGDFESPQAVVENLEPPEKDGTSYQGKAAMGALRFKTRTLAPGEKTNYILILGIAQKDSDIDHWVKQFGSLQKAETALKISKDHWNAKANSVRFRSQDSSFDCWLRWVGLQPTLRKLFGCSFLPDFDYGRGGRGWRDLWQDCLALLLTSPTEAKRLLLNNFNGVRIDGSNASIIGSETSEFIADRNHITRVWMDHGVWPFLTLSLYMHQTGDVAILLQNTQYFRDRQFSRARQKDPEWSEATPKNLKTKTAQAAEGTVLEHILVQHLVQFFNVGEHNHIRLENADWNDGLDMAYERGESVAFTAFYGWNLKQIADTLEEVAKRLNFKKVTLARELLILLDRVTGKKIDYDSVKQKCRRLETYFDAVQPVISGKKVEVPVARLVQDLREKSEFIADHIRRREWIQTQTGEGLFNGYYDNHGRRVEGQFPSGFRMTLAGQVFPIMAGVANPSQILEIFQTAKKHLKDKEYGGFRLNTNFHEIRLDLGRAFSFAYGEKENGAFFSHMAVMFANALYQRGFINEGHEVLDSIYRMCVRTEKSKIYPGIPEYFNSEGRGMYHYLTGSASWLLMTMLTQVFGMRGYYGDLLLAPKFTRDDFRQTYDVGIEADFAGRRFTVTYKNPKKLPYEHYCVTRVAVNGKELKNLELNKKEVLIPRETLLRVSRKSANTIVVTLE